METFKATINRKDNNATLRLSLNTKQLDIVLTEDKPNEVKSVFNKLLEQLKKAEFYFNLEDNEGDLYHHICEEYIKQLNVELKSTYKELKDHGLVKE